MIAEVSVLKGPKPAFNRDQIVSAEQVQKQWRATVQPKLDEFPYLVMFSGPAPSTALMDFTRFESLWQQAVSAAEREFEVEVLSRMLHMVLHNEPLVSLADAAAKLGITASDLEAAPDVDLESE